MSLQYILNFHRIFDSATTSNPESDLYSVTRSLFEDACILTKRAAYLSITLDDGYLSDYETAFPILKKHGLNAIFFVSSDNIGRPGYCSRKQLLEMYREGMGIGLHGMFHRPWRGIAPAGLEKEHLFARKHLEDIIGNPIENAACPFGSYDRRVIRSLRDHGIRTIYTSDGGWARESDWLKRRNTIHSDQSISDIREDMALERSGTRIAVNAFKTLIKGLR